MVYVLFVNLLICFGCFYLLNWEDFFNNQQYKLKFLAIFTVFTNIPFVNLFLLIYLILNNERG